MSDTWNVHYVLPADWPHGVRCAECGDEMDVYTIVPLDLDVVLVVCLGCAASIELLGSGEQR